MPMGKVIKLRGCAERIRGQAACWNNGISVSGTGGVGCCILCSTVAVLLAEEYLQQVGARNVYIFSKQLRKIDSELWQLEKRLLYYIFLTTSGRGTWSQKEFDYNLKP